MKRVRFDPWSFTPETAENYLTEKGCQVTAVAKRGSALVAMVDGEVEKGVSGPGVLCEGDTVWKAGTQSPDDPMEFIMSDETVDRMGDVVRASGWELDGFRKNPVALMGHDHDKIIGVWEQVRTVGSRLMGKLRLAKPGTSDVVDVARSLLEQRILKTVSVGFSPIEAQPRDRDDPWSGVEFTRASLLECSLVAVPANPNALQVVRAISPAMADQFFVRADAKNPAIAGTLSRAADLKTPRLDTARQRLRRKGYLE